MLNILKKKINADSKVEAAGRFMKVINGNIKLWSILDNINHFIDRMPNSKSIKISMGYKDRDDGRQMMENEDNNIKIRLTYDDHIDNYQRLMMTYYMYCGYTIIHKQWDFIIEWGDKSMLDNIFNKIKGMPCDTNLDDLVVAHAMTNNEVYWQLNCEHNKIVISEIKAINKKIISAVDNLEISHELKGDVSEYKMSIAHHFENVGFKVNLNGNYLYIEWPKHFKKGKITC